jgi:hypothetical protein
LAKYKPWNGEKAARSAARPTTQIGTPQPLFTILVRLPSMRQNRIFEREDNEQDTSPFRVQVC